MRCALLAVLAALLAAGCSSPRYDVARPVSHALERPEDTSLGRTQAAQLAATPGQSGFHLLVSGQEAFLARAAQFGDAALVPLHGEEDRGVGQEVERLGIERYLLELAPKCDHPRLVLARSVVHDDDRARREL